MSTLFGKKAKRKATNITTTKTHGDDKTPNTSCQQQQTDNDTKKNDDRYIFQFSDLGLSPLLTYSCTELGFKTPTPVQKKVIPAVLRGGHVLALAATGSGKTAAYVLPILEKLLQDPYGIFAVVLSPTRELAKQVHEQVMALGASMKVKSCLVIGGCDMVQQSCELSRHPHFCIATPGRLAYLLRESPEPKPPLKNIRFLVLDEADRLLSPQTGSGFERDVAEIILSSGTKRQTLLFSATMTASLDEVETFANGGHGRLPLEKYIISEEDEEEGVAKSSGISKIPAGLVQEYIFMPSRVRDAYLITAVRTLMVNGGKRGDEEDDEDNHRHNRKRNKDPRKQNKKQKSSLGSGWNNLPQREEDEGKSQSAIIFCSTCERTAQISGILSEFGVDSIPLHSLLSQNRRLASLAKFKSQQARILVATDVASRGLDIPQVDLVVNAELPRLVVDYVHRVGRTARAGRRGRAISLVSEHDISLVKAIETMTQKEMKKCMDVKDDDAIQLLNFVTKAARLTKMKLMDIGFDEAVKRRKERKNRDRKEREKLASLAKNAVLKKSSG